MSWQRAMQASTSWGRVSERTLVRPRDVCLVIAVTVSLAAVQAYANGRAPETNGVVLRPGDAHSIYARSTFGLLISHDDGCTFQWVCEDNIGYGGSFDPKYAIAGDGTIFAATFNGLRASRDGGCSFAAVTDALPIGDPGRIADRYASALAIGPTGDVWVGTADSGKPNDVYVSTDVGVTFLPSNLESPTVFWQSLAVAPSDARRIYVAGNQFSGTAADGGQIAPAAYLFRSDDHGAGWMPMALANVVVAPTPLVTIAAVDPVDSSIVFVLSVGANPPSGDRLYRSTDGGAFFDEALATTEPISDLVIRGPTAAVAATLHATFASNNGGASFAPIANPAQLGCLGQRSDGALIGCGTNADAFSIGRSSDATQWQKLFKLADLAGPIECPAGTREHDICDQLLWRPLQIQLGAKGPASCSPEAPDAGDPPRKPSAPGGCCSSDRDAASLLLGLAVGVLLLKPTRRRVG